MFIFIFCFPKLIPLAIGAVLLLLILYLLNRSVIRKIELQRTAFQINGNIRNVDYLIIGDMINSCLVVPPGKSFVQINAPNRSLTAAFEILKHTSSILDEDCGNVVIAVAGKNVRTEKIFSVFDVPFLYNLTIQKYNLENIAKISRLTFLIKPLSSIKLLLNINVKKWEEVKCSNNDIIRFCDERNIHLKYFEC